MCRVHVSREASIRRLLRLSNPRPSRPAKYGAEVIWLAHCMQSVTVLFSVNEKMAEKRKRTDLSLADKVKVVNMLGDKLTQTEIATRLGILLFHNGRVFITLRNRYSRVFCIRVFFRV